MRISILAVLTASLTAVGAQAADAPDEIRLGTVYTGSIACGLSVGGGGGSHAPQPEGARGSARAPSSLSIRAIGPYRRNFSNGVSRGDGTASLDAPRSQVPAFPRQD
jgi:hypothetical protein